MKISDYIKNQSQLVRDEWFKEHKAQLLLGIKSIPCCERDHNFEGDCDRHPKGIIRQTEMNPVILIGWQNPKSWNYGCRFIIHRRWLTVVGDLGEAVYEWSEDLTLTFLASIELSYFLSKCRASETGKDFNTVDAHVAREQFQQFKDEINDKKVLEILNEWDGCFDKHDLFKLAQKIYDQTGYPETASHIASLGTVPHCRAIAHFVGLQMAIQQLTKK